MMLAIVDNEYTLKVDSTLIAVAYTHTNHERGAE